MSANPQTGAGIDDQRSPLPPEGLVDRLVDSMAGAFDLYAMYVGEQLGLYRSLYEQGPATSSELAGRTGMHERYAREWLEHQAISGMLTLDDPGRPAQQRGSHGTDAHRSGGSGTQPALGVPHRIRRVLVSVR